jgi:hypothetical protein
MTRQSHRAMYDKCSEAAKQKRLLPREWITYCATQKVQAGRYILEGMTSVCLYLVRGLCFSHEDCNLLLKDQVQGSVRSRGQAGRNSRRSASQP